MNPKTFIAVAAVFLMALASPLSAAEPAWTTITVKDMCCKGCAQKIAARLYTVRGVKEVRADFEQKTLFVAPQQNTALSPLALWEAVEKAKEAPIRLAGPNGTCNEKPNF